ncbi:MAG: hypothetical protein JJU30_13730 [Alkalimonas sp.]|nr:hypothetical protein [Alkalimonas sp.]
METVRNKAERMTVVSFNPAIKRNNEKSAVQLILELNAIHDMPDDLSKALTLREWHERDLDLAEEILIGN